MHDGHQACVTGQVLRGGKTAHLANLEKDGDAEDISISSFSVARSPKPLLQKTMSAKFSASVGLS
jgi:hypothetical protein